MLQSGDSTLAITLARLKFYETPAEKTGFVRAFNIGLWNKAVGVPYFSSRPTHMQIWKGINQEILWSH